MIYKTTRIYGFIVTGAKSCSEVNVCAGHCIAFHQKGRISNQDSEIPYYDY